MGLVLFDALQNVLRDVDLGVDLHVDAVQLFGNVVQVDLLFYESRVFVCFSARQTKSCFSLY